MCLIKCVFCLDPHLFKVFFVIGKGGPCRHSLADDLVTLSRGFNLILRKSAISLSSSCSLGRWRWKKKEENKVSKENASDGQKEAKLELGE